ncbi:MAG: hypothetical protein AAFZ18_12295 [Myxococcota bacterium]
MSAQGRPPNHREQLLDSARGLLAGLDALPLERFELESRFDAEPLWRELEAYWGGLPARLHDLAQAVSTAAGAPDRPAPWLSVAPEDLGSATATPTRNQFEARLDGALRKVPGHGGPDAALARLGPLLLAIVAEHGERLSQTELQSNNPLLVAELHELRTRSTLVVEAMAAALGGPTGDAPGFRSGGERSAALRQWSAELSEGLEALHRTPLGASVAGALRIVNEACERAPFGWLRGHDRAEVQGFRRWAMAASLRCPEEGAERLARLTGWARMMDRVNDSLLLIRHDLEALSQVTDGLVDVKRDSELLEGLEPLFGRDARLDALIRGARTAPLDRAALRRLLPGLKSFLAGIARA